MRGTLIQSMLIVLLATGCPVRAQTKNVLASPMSNRDRAIAFAVYKEDLAQGFQTRKDVCVEFSTLLTANQKGILADLKQRKLSVHSYTWCNKSPTGLIISVLAPVEEPAPGTFEITIEVGDARPILERGEHFGTLLRRGIYTIKCEDGSKTVLVQYKEVPREDHCGGNDHC
jgi:hypothetical protein